MADQSNGASAFATLVSSAIWQRRTEATNATDRHICWYEIVRVAIARLAASESRCQASKSVTSAADNLKVISPVWAEGRVFAARHACFNPAQLLLGSCGIVDCCAALRSQKLRGFSHAETEMTHIPNVRSLPQFGDAEELTVGLGRGRGRGSASPKRRSISLATARHRLVRARSLEIEPRLLRKAGSAALYV
jgi:hypothetical protein